MDRTGHGLARVARWGLAFVVCCSVAKGGEARAQEGVADASVSGHVTDASGAVIVSAVVTMTQTATNVRASVETDVAGRFRFSLVRVGAYELIVDQPGFQTARRSLVIAAGAAFELPIVLSIDGLSTTVIVHDDVPVLETARTQTSGTIPRAEVRALPVNGRNFLELALLVPGVAPANVGAGTQLFPETSAVSGVSLSVGGQRNLSNSVLVDGLSANDDAAALSGMPYSVDAVEQLQIVTSGGQAELGRALGGYVNVVTRSGTNTAEGSAYVYGRGDRLNARNGLLDRVLPMNQAQFGGVAGGPISRSRTFFFGSVERNRLDQSGLVTILPENVEAINARLRASGYPGPPVTTGVYMSPIRSIMGMGKVDTELADHGRLSVRYSLYRVGATNTRGVGALSAPTASSALENLDQTVAAIYTRVLGARTLLQFRTQVSPSTLEAPASDPVGPAVSISGIGTFGTLSSSPTGRRNVMSQVVGGVTRLAGAHALRAGLDALYNDLTIVFPRTIRGSYTFSSLATFLDGVYGNGGFVQTFGESTVHQTNPNLGLYVQDEWKAGRTLTFNLGLRYDLQSLETITTDRNNWSPRVGVAWVPSASRQTVIRGSAGVFYDRVPLRALANALLSAGNTTDLTQLRQINVSLSPGQFGAPVFPQILPGAVPSGTLVNLTTMARDIQNARSTQASVEIERQVDAATAVTVGYQILEGRELIAAINQNVPTCVAAGTNNGCRPNASYANNSQYTSAGRSSFRMLSLSVVGRPGRRGGYRVSYALSKSMNDVGEAFFSAPIDPGDLSKDWGRANGDQRHRVVVNGSIEIPDDRWALPLRGIQLSGTLQYYSAPPLNVTSGVTTLQGTPGRPLVDGQFLERNAEQGEPFVAANLRVSRTFQVGPRTKIEALAEVFNLLNATNVVALNGNFGPGRYPDEPATNFRRTTAVGDPRTIQLGLRMSF